MSPGGQTSPRWDNDALFDTISARWA